MKKFNILLLSILLVLVVSSCKNNENNLSDTGTENISYPQEEIQKLAPKNEPNAIQLYALQKSPYMMQQVLEPLLQPFWYTREVYNETFMFIGKEGVANLLYSPTEIISIKDYSLNKIYVEGKDFTISGNTIKRTANSSMPYVNAEDYWVDEQTKQENTDSSISFYAVKESASVLSEYNLEGNRYFKVRENILPQYYQCVISYKHNDSFPSDGFYPQGEGIEKFIDKLRNEKKASIVFYGDSITEGWSASGHIWDYSIEPNMSSWAYMVEDYLEKKYDATIDVTNEAIGGWTSLTGYYNFDKKMDGSVPHRHAHEDTDRSHASLKPDLLVLGFGMNDYDLDPSKYYENISKIVEKYYKLNPNGNVILVSSMPANTDSTMECNQKLFEDELEKIAQEYEGTVVAPIYSTYQQLFKMGKTSRDLLSNNINHPNDFGVRVYAQVVLKTLLGIEFSNEENKVSE